MILAFLKWFCGGGCLFLILPLSEQEGLAHLQQVGQPPGVYYKQEAQGDQMCPGAGDGPAGRAPGHVRKWHQYSSCFELIPLCLIFPFLLFEGSY